LVRWTSGSLLALIENSADEVRTYPYSYQYALKLPLMQLTSM
jgi:hypothetical protein